MYQIFMIFTVILQILSALLVSHINCVQSLTTQEDVPHKNPENVVGRGTAPDNLVIRWTPMPPIEQNGEHFFYKVFWKRSDNPNARWETKQLDNWKDGSFTIINQPTFKPYRIKVEAHNRRGQAHTQATEVIGYSGEDKPLQTPQNFRSLEVLDSRSAVFVWEGVQSESVRGHFRGYKIQTWTDGEQEKHMREVVVQPNVTQAIVQVLKPFSRNYARIIVFNDAFTSDPSNEVIVQTPEGIPGPVAAFDGISMGSNALYLFWTRPDEPNGVLAGYRIFYETVTGTQSGTKLERLPQIDDPLTTGAKLAGLKAGTKYRVTIHAITKMGLGDPFYIEFETKPEDSAEYPDKPSFDWYHTKNIDGNDEIRVQWNPNSGNGKRPGSYFYVQYRLKGTEIFKSTPKDENQDSTVVNIKGLKDYETYEIRVVAVDGQYETPSEVQEISSSRIITRGPNGSSTIRLADLGPWFIEFIDIMCALIIVLVVLVCIMKRNRGGKHSVDEKEAAQGREDYDLGGTERFENTPKDENQDSTVVNIKGLKDDENYGIRVVAVDGQYIPFQYSVRRGFGIS